MPFIARNKGVCVPHIHTSIIGSAGQVLAIFAQGNRPYLARLDVVWEISVSDSCVIRQSAMSCPHLQFDPWPATVRHLSLSISAPLLQNQH